MTTYQPDLKMWEKFPELTEMVRKDHIEKEAFGSHDFLHALMVAQYGVLIVDDELTAQQAWVAGIIHNTDRLFPEEKVLIRLLQYLSAVTLSLDERNAIMNAVLCHSSPNQDNDSEVKMAFQDADRLANMGPNMIIRSGQHYHNLLAYDPRFVVKPDPRATYKDPMTVLHDIRCALEWEKSEDFGLRLPKARGLAIYWLSELNRYTKGFFRQLTEVNLYPYPFPEDLELAYQKQKNS